MDNYVLLEFDGAFCRVAKAPSQYLKEIDSLLYFELSYQDRSLSYMAYKTGRNIDPFQTVYDKTRRRFSTGFLIRVISLLTKKGYVVDLECTIKPTKQVKPELPDWLYEHQVKAINTLLDNPRSCVESPTGSGKSIMIVYLIKAFPEANILVTVPSSTLLQRTVSDIEERLGEKVGKVGGGKKEWKRITVGIINSVINEAKKDPSLLNQINVCIKDEVHETAAARFIELNNYLTNCFYSYGLSATIDRADGKLILIEGGIGPTVLKISEKEVETKKVIFTPTVIKIPFRHERNLKYEGAREISSGVYHYNTTNGKPDVGAVYKKSIENNESRDQLILDACKLLLKSPLRKGGVLILVKGIEHGRSLSAMAKEQGMYMPFLSGSNKVEERLKYLELLRNRELDLLCTTSIFNQGEDIKPLEAVVLAGAGCNKRILIQQIGRVTRTCEGKNWALFIDIDDNEPFYLSHHSSKRDAIIKERHNTAIHNMSLNQLEEFLNRKSV